MSYDTEDGRTPDVDAWVDRELTGPLDAFLDHVVDVEAGLAAVLTQARHNEATDALDNIVDVEAGLAALLTPPAILPPAVPSLSTPGIRFPALPALPRSAAPEDRADARRMHLRSHPSVAPLRRVLDRAIVVGVRPDELLSLMPEPLRMDVLRSLLIELDLLAAELERAVASESPGNDRLFAALSTARELTHGLAKVRQIPRGVGLDTFLARQVALLVDQLMSQCLEAVNVAVASFVHVMCWRSIQVEDRALFSPPKGDLLRTREEADWLFNDFTKANLTRTTVRVDDLDAVRWSKTRTRWPAGMDTADLAARSEETAPGSGVYIVLPGPAHVMA